MAGRTFEAVTVTSMFMHGAKNRESAELRPPAFRGVMRYWFRALAGSRLELDALRRVEEEVFGSTEAGQRLVVRVKPPVAGNSRAPLLPHKQERRERSESPAVEAGRGFEITLTSIGEGGGIPSDGRLDLASWSLWLACQLAGFGQRARRGAGSLRLLRLDPPLPGVSVSREGDLVALKAAIEAGLGGAVACVRRCVSGARQGGATAAFPVLGAGSVRIVVGKLDARDEGGARRRVMKLREAADPSHRDQAFGGIGPRLASPVHVRLEPADRNSYVAVVTWFREPRHGRPELVEDFLNRVKGGEGLEVVVP